MIERDGFMRTWLVENERMRLDSDGPSSRVERRSQINASIVRWEERGTGFNSADVSVGCPDGAMSC